MLLGWEISMNNLDKQFRFNHLNLWSILVLVWCSKLFKFSLIIGSVRAFFSLINVTGPLTVVWGGLSGGMYFLLLTSLMNSKTVLLTGLLGSSGLPNLMAGIYLRSHNKLIKIIIPSLCMLLFWHQTWGTIGMAYALLWIIPIVISALQIEHFYFKSLAATFIAHAIGSIIWLYGANLSSHQWFALIPVALAERLILATVMSVVYNLVKNAKCQISAYLKTNLKAEGAAL